MAHPCINCGDECFCHGDISDSIDSLTPHNCDGCGCEDEFDPDHDPDDDEPDYEEPGGAGNPDMMGPNAAERAEQMHNYQRLK